MSATDAETRAVAAVAADLLDHGRRIHDVSRLLTFAAGLGLIAGMVLAPSVALAALLGLTALLGLVETYLAIRVGFDAALLARLSDQPGTLPDLETLDGALTMLGLINPGKVGRPIGVRAAGALRLLAWQGRALAGQAVILLAGAFAARGLA
jgi:hypothetical protein